MGCVDREGLGVGLSGQGSWSSGGNVFVSTLWWLLSGGWVGPEITRLESQRGGDLR